MLRNNSLLYFTNIFFLKTKDIPILYSYKIYLTNSGGKSLNHIIPKLSYRMNKSNYANWLSFGNQLITDTRISTDDVLVAIKPLLKDIEPDLSINTEVLFNKYWRPSPQIVSKYLSNKYLKLESINYRVKEIIDKNINEEQSKSIITKPVFDNIVINNKPAVIINLKEYRFFDIDIYKILLQNKLDVTAIKGKWVVDPNTGFNGIITELLGELGDGERKNKLINIVTNIYNKKIIKNASKNSILVKVCKNNHKYYYLLENLRMINNNINNHMLLPEYRVWKKHYIGFQKKIHIIKEISELLKGLNVIEKHSLNSDTEMAYFTGITCESRIDIVMKRLLSKKRNHRQNISNIFLMGNNNRRLSIAVLNYAGYDFMPYINRLRNLLKALGFTVEFHKPKTLYKNGNGFIDKAVRQYNSDSYDLILIVIPDYSIFDEEYFPQHNSKLCFFKRVLMSSQKLSTQINRLAFEILIKTSMLRYNYYSAQKPICNIYLTIKKVKNTPKENLYIISMVIFNNKTGLLRNIRRKEWITPGYNNYSNVLKLLLPEADIKNANVLIVHKSYCPRHFKNSIIKYLKRICSELYFYEVHEKTNAEIFVKKAKGEILPAENITLKISDSVKLFQYNKSRCLVSNVFSSNKISSGRLNNAMLLYYLMNL